MVLEKSLESSLAWKVIQPLNPKGNQSWIFIGITDAEAESPVLWSTDVKNWLHRKDSDAGKDWRWEKKRTTKDEMIEWHHWLDGHEFEQSPGIGDRQGSLAFYSQWSHKESDMTALLIWIYIWIYPYIHISIYLYLYIYISIYIYPC